jgi:hypothetical protein
MKICAMVAGEISCSIPQAETHSRCRCHDIVILSQLNSRMDAFFQILRLCLDRFE